MSADIVRYAGGGNALARTGDDEVVGAQRQFVTVVIERQTFGIPVLVVQDILGPQKITRVPLAPAEVAGALNLRGRIVTAINVRRRLGLAPRPAEMKGMNVVVEHDGELYSLMVDGWARCSLSTMPGSNATRPISRSIGETSLSGYTD
jgi:purine-binding chemotaxis protein CheW